MHRRTFIAATLPLLALTTASGACGRLDRDLYGADDLAFVFKSFNWETGGATGVVIEGHTATVVWVTSQRHEGPDGTYIEPVFWKRTLELETEELNGLRQALADARFLRLQNEYVDRNISDGQDDLYVLRLGSRTHSVHLKNKSPARISNVDRAVDRIRKRAEGENGVRMTGDELTGFWDDALAE